MGQAQRDLWRALCAAAVALSWSLPASAGAAGANGAPDAPAAAAQAGRPSVRLTVVFTRGDGARHVAHLRCSPTRSTADGFLRSSGGARACARARRIRTLLTTPPRTRACTQIYGGPERATVTGRIGTRRVARRFSRTNGCQIADWTAAQPLLPRPRGPVGP
jgi:hypothetical protein